MRRRKERFRRRGRNQQKKKLPYLFIEADEDHVPLQEKRGNHHIKRKKRKKSRILAKLVYVHEGKEVSSPGRAKLKNPHDFAGCYEDTEELFFEVLEYLEENYDLNRWKQSSSVVMGLLLKKGLEIIPQSIFVLPRFHLGRRIREALPRNGSEEKLWRAMEEGSWENVAAFFSQALLRKESSRERRKLKDLCTYLSCNWEGIQNARNSQVTVSAEAHGSLSFQRDSPTVPWAGGGKG
jgi:hypothetical protein